MAVGNVARSGSYGLVEGPTSTNDVAYQDIIGLIPGQTYVVSVWVLSSSTNSGVVTLAIHDTQGNNVVSTPGVTPGTASWLQLTLAYTVTSNGAMRIHLYELAGSETTYWDDVSMTASPPVNAGFESGSLGPWQGWGIAVGSTAHSGSYGLTEGPTSSNDVAFQNIYGLTPGQTYLVSAWVMSSSSSTGQVELAVANTATWLQNVVTPTTSWTQISQPFTVGPDGYMRVHLYELAGSETVYWDDVSITPLPPANAGFESGSLGPWQGWGITVGSTAHSGSYGLTEAPTSSSDVAFQDMYGLIPSQTYLVSAWVKSSSASSGQVSLGVHDTLGNGYVAASVTPGVNWQQISQAYTVSSNGAMRVHLYELAGSETAYWDDVSITPLPPANAGFESGSLGPWQGWGITVGSTAHSGSYGLTEAPTSSNDVAFQDIYGLIPGQTYLVSAWVKSSTASSGQVSLGVHDTLGNGYVATSITPSVNWQQISQAYTVTSNGAMRVHLYELAGSETAYWDDVTITATNGATPASIFSQNSVWENFNTSDLWSNSTLYRNWVSSPAKEYIHFNGWPIAIESQE